MILSGSACADGPVQLRPPSQLGDDDHAAMDEYGDDQGEDATFGGDGTGDGDDAGDDRPPPPGGDDGEGDGGDGDDPEPPGGDGPGPASCPSHCYCESFDVEADVSDLEAGFIGANWADTMIGVLDRRYPAGADLLVEMQGDPWFGAFTDTSSFSALMDSVMTEVHEGTHGWDWNHALGQPYFGYWLRANLVYEPPKIDGFPRSEILPMVEGDATSLYDGTYLTGTQGTYGWYELHDELNAYINGMGAITAAGEFLPWGVSGKDGALAFLYYVALYLERARTVYPDLYAQLRAEPEWVELVQTQWLRTHFLLEFADSQPNVGIHDQEIRALLYARQAEIEMFVGRPLEASSCLP